MKYTIVGCITKYGVEQIRPFVESIEQCGFKGEKLMLVYDISKETIEYLDVVKPFAGEGIALEGNISKWWAQQEYKVGHNEGLFKHNDYYKYGK